MKSIKNNKNSETMKINVEIIEKILNVLLVVLQFIIKKEKEEPSTNEVAIAAAARQLNPELTDEQILAKLQDGIDRTKIIDEV